MLKFISKHKSPAPSITVETADVVRDVPIEKAKTVLELLVENRIEIPHSCGGMGTCGTCRIEILQAPADFGERNEIEAEFASERGFRANERLACQSEPQIGLKIRVPENQSK